MPDTYEVILTIRKNGKPIDGYDPLYRRITVQESQSFKTEEADDGNDSTFSDLPATQITSIELLLCEAVDQALGIRAYAGSAANDAIRLNAGGFILIFDAEGITNTDADVNNNSSATAITRGIIGGT